MKIIDRYITRELLIPFTVVAVILAALFSSFSSARFLASAASESLGLAAMLKFILLKTVIALEVLMPIALIRRGSHGAWAVIQRSGDQRAYVPPGSARTAQFLLSSSCHSGGIASGVLSIFRAALGHMKKATC